MLVLKKKPLSNEDFLRHVRDYLPMDATVWNTDEKGKPCSCAISTGMIENHFYRFDAEAVLAASHAIEELALEEANGFLLATMQDFRHFDPHRERYWQLAATLKEAHVIAKGRKPPRHGHLKFIATERQPLAPFWTVLYQGHHCQAMLVCRQADGAKIFEQKRFDGFYTFNPDLIGRVRRDIEEILAGCAARMREFERLLGMHAGPSPPIATLIYADLDRFKKLNDTLGHAAGDAALRHIAGILVSAVRDKDLVARIGGEEFAVWMPHTPMDAGLEVAERIRRTVETKAWRWDGEPHPLTLSCGVASYPASVRDVKNLRAAADAALYRAKEAGRNRVEKASAAD